MKARPTSDSVLIERLLPSVNSDPRDRIEAWGEWYASEGEASVLAFVRVKNDTSEPDMDILQDAMITAYLEVERGRYEPRAGISFAAYVKGIARNKIREARRRTRRFVPLDNAPEHLLSDERHLDTVIEYREQRAILRSGLTRLSASSGSPP